MPIRNFLILGTTVALGFVLGYSGVKWANQRFGDSSVHELASKRPSLPMAKMGSQQLADQILEFALDTDKVGKTESDSTSLVIKVTSHFTLPEGLNYKWVLPPEVHVISGNTEGQLSKLEKDQTQEFAILVNGFSKEIKRYITFSVSGKAKNMNFEKDILLSSRIEDSLEYKMHQSAIKEKQENQKTPFKVQSQKNNKFSPENVIK